MRTVVRIVIVAVVLFMLAFAAWWVMNKGSGSGTHQRIEMKAVAVACDTPCMKKRNRVESRVRSTHPIALAKTTGSRCVGMETVWSYRNWAGQTLFNLHQSVKACGEGAKPGRFASGPVWNRWWDDGDDPWWNGWRLVRWEDPVTGGGINADGWRYRYRRQAGYFQSCWLGTCWMDEKPWAAQTVRTNGGFFDDVGP
jgi:hypothetical protein